MTPSTKGAIVVAIMAVVGLAFMPATVAAGQSVTVAQVNEEGATVTLEPTETTVAEGETITYEIILKNANGGVGAFDNITVTVGNGDVATITDVSMDTDDFPRSVSGVNDAGTRAHIHVPFAGNTTDTGEVVLGEISVEAEEAGSTTLDLALTGDIAKESGLLYNIKSVADSELTVEEQPSSVFIEGPDETSPGETVTYDVVMTNADEGVGAFDRITFEVTNPDVASIAEVSVHDSFSRAIVETTDNRADVTLPFGGETETGTVTLYSVTVEAEEGGQTDLSVNVTRDIASIPGTLYTISAIEGKTVDIDTQMEDVTGNGETPADIDDDGQYEDVNGNGEFNRGDIQALLNAQKSDAISDHVDAFDFNGNGEIDVGDIQALFDEYES